MKPGKESARPKPQVRTGRTKAKTSAPILADADAQTQVDVLAKRRATWIARAALAGHELRRMQDGAWRATLGQWSREIPEPEVDRWLDRIGAPK